MRRVALVLALSVVAVGCGGGGEEESTRARVARVIDGDTLALADGRRVRLVQIDAPEEREHECHAAAAAAALERLLPPGTTVRLERDPELDAVDRFGRLLRYAHRGSVNVNLALVERGAAAVWFFEGGRGRYAKELLAATREARARGRGLWADCPGARLAPNEPLATE